ncbi:hypothetical protein [Companilactobacillus mishanensis]|uniref:Uncharacterized protein n=1 Tax=Companilactobacillus mishanensis TaxID=2486008 RepID=A0A5P0ZKF9_9LACO|nr:hypothetical protein [Companilactobacillus mishanensis]MQS45511.1 hypothetical protein [Companilactobacillus mishanensis]MQS53563.1 hypothetical protein [Companilactobacillus mishanensis]MQS89236.1 hypothetical protein [Companilactobacillus mishanensis]
MQIALILLGSIIALLMEKYIFANNKRAWLGAIIPISSIILVTWLLVSARMTWGLADLIIGALFVFFNFIFWSQGNSLYHRRRVRNSY